MIQDYLLFEIETRCAGPDIYTIKPLGWVVFTIGFILIARDVICCLRQRKKAIKNDKTG